mmetsp:Transcript_11653/g.32987  ORF Transcript_11653/g.32987 Transcript_11653/m.32987 type:complete len:206 (-) Transcript_11653:219-836(-)
MTSIGRKEKDVVMRKMPRRNTPPNWASLAGDRLSAARPEMLCPACDSLSFAPAAAAAALSLACCAPLAPIALAADSPAALFPCRSFASCCATFPFSENTVPACVAPSATRPRPRATSLCQPLACSPRSASLAFSATCAMPCRASSAASVTCLWKRPAAAFAHRPHSDFASPFSTSSDSVVSCSDCDTGSYTSRVFSATIFRARSQ